MWGRRHGLDKDSAPRSLVVVVVDVVAAVVVGGREVPKVQVRRNARAEKVAGVAGFARHKTADVAVVGVVGDAVDFG